MRCTYSLSILYYSSDITRFRLYEAMMRASAISNGAFECSQDIGLMDRMLSDLTMEDPLTTVNVVELFAMVRIPI